jgi:hypothetical protein
MRICIIGKYPPIEGGVSARTFDYARILAEKGHEVHVVTNAPEVEPQFRIWLDDADRARLNTTDQGVTWKVHTLDPIDHASYIPWTNPFLTRLAGLATEVVRQNKCELIFSYYLEPYGVAAFLASAWTGVPYAISYEWRGSLAAH